MSNFQTEVASTPHHEIEKDIEMFNSNTIKRIKDHKSETDLRPSMQQQSSIDFVRKQS